MSQATIIRVLPKNAKESVRVALDTFKGVDLIDIRVTANPDDPADDPIMTKKGLSIRVEQLPALIEALKDAEVEARSRGLLDRKAA